MYCIEINNCIQSNSVDSGFWQKLNLITASIQNFFYCSYLYILTVTCILIMSSIDIWKVYLHLYFFRFRFRFRFRFFFAADCAFHHFLNALTLFSSKFVSPGCLCRVYVPRVLCVWMYSVTQRIRYHGFLFSVYFLLFYTSIR